MDPTRSAAGPSLAPDLVHPRDLGHGELSPTIGDPEYGWHLLAEGDSWFTIGAIPSSNLLYELRLRRWTQIFNLAYPGDTIKHISELVDNADLHTWLAKRNFATRFDGLLLSGGGNDVIAACGDLIRPTPQPGSNPAWGASYLNEDPLNALLGAIQQGFARIVALRDSATSLSQGAPAFVHTYDYATPRNAPARFAGGIALIGPWLYKVFRNTGLDVVLQQRIANALTDRLAEALLALDSVQGQPGVRLPAFHVLDTRNTLVPANPTDIGSSNDWLNEIHPTLDGYRKIAARISAAVNANLP